MQGLLLHCGANLVTHEEVVDTKTPNATRSHRPIPHEYLIRGVFYHMERLGFKLEQAAHALSHEGNRYFGLFQFSRDLWIERDYGIVVGLRNSHDKAISITLAIGGNVFVCDNLSISGEFMLARKHTARVMQDLPLKIQNTVELLPNAMKFQDRRFEAYKNHELSRTEANDLIIRAYESGACTTSQIGKVVKEYKDPRHPEFKDKTAWSLFNAFTEVFKGGLQQLPFRTQALHSIMDEHTGVSFDHQSGESRVISA